MPSRYGVTGTSPSAASESWAIADGNGSSVAAIVTSPAASGTALSIAATQSLIATASPPRLNTRAPSGSGAAGKQQRPGHVLGVLEQGRPAERDLVALAKHGGGDRDGRAARHPLVAADAVHGHRPEADARNAGVPPVDPGVALVCQLVHAVVVARVRRRRPPRAGRSRGPRPTASTSRSSPRRPPAPRSGRAGRRPRRR